jgi:hypothetical protein
MATGEGAEEMVEDMPNIGHQIIHEHEELAEKLALVLYLLGAVSIGGVFLNIKMHAKATLVSYITLAIGIGVVYLATQVGNSGGKIRHTEIREAGVGDNYEKEDAVPANVLKQNDKK